MEHLPEKRGYWHIYQKYHTNKGHVTIRKIQKRGRICHRRNSEWTIVYCKRKIWLIRQKNIFSGSGATSHMKKKEEKMKNIQDPETRTTVGNSGTLTGRKCGDCHIYQKHYGKFYCHSRASLTTTTTTCRHTKIIFSPGTLAEEIWGSRTINGFYRPASLVTLVSILGLTL